MIGWAPLGRGVLTGKYRHGTPADSRGASPHFARYVGRHRNEAAARVVEAVATAADGLGTSPLAVAAAWVRDRPGVASVVIGARDAAQLLGGLAAETITLSAEITAALDDVSDPADTAVTDHVFAEFCAAGLWPGVGKGAGPGVSGRRASPAPVTSASGPAAGPAQGHRQAGRPAVHVLDRGRPGLRAGGDADPEEIPARWVPRLIEALGDSAATVLRSDPWRLLALPDAMVGQADRLARRSSRVCGGTTHAGGAL